MRILTKIKSAAVLLLLAGLLLSANNRWGATNSQEGVSRDRVQRPSKTFDDRRKHTIKLIVRYRPARQLVIVWGIGERGDTNYRGPGDRPVWEESGEVWDGTPANVAVDSVDGGYLYCAIEQDGEIVREHPDENTKPNDKSCDLVFVAGGR